jgi:hypothetical protein
MEADLIGTAFAMLGITTYPRAVACQYFYVSPCQSDCNFQMTFTERLLSLGALVVHAADCATLPPQLGILNAAHDCNFVAVLLGDLPRRAASR